MIHLIIVAAFAITVFGGIVAAIVHIGPLISKLRNH